MPEQSVNFDRAADYYDATRGFPDGVAPKVGQFIAENVPFTKNSHLLEVGIGTGRIALPLAPHVGSITGFDISWEMMAKLRQNRTDEPIELAAADAHTMPFADRSFNAVMITHVLHLVPDPARVLEEIKRVIKSDGVFVHMRNKYHRGQAFQAVFDAWNTTTSIASEQSHRQWFSVDDLIIDSGWIVQDVYEYTYPYTANLDDYLISLEQRQWSHTWPMDDTIWQSGIEAVQQAVVEHFAGNRDVESPAEGAFQVQVYRAS